MGRATSRNSSVSIVTVDPAVASQITKTSTTEETRKSSDAGSINAPSSRTKSSHTTIKSTPRKPEQTRKDVLRGRGNSLRRVRNSTEVLRQRTARQEIPEPESDDLSNTREGRNFTVGNVGTGGYLYLKPSVQKPQHTAQTRPLVFPLTPPKSAPLLRDTDENATGHNPATSVLPPRPYTPSMTLKRSTTNAGKGLGNPIGMPRHGRSHSFSSVDERKSEESKTGALRIVINRSTPTRPRHAPNFTLPTLEVPIPHYRLGTPRFSTQGTAILRNSYTRASAAPSDNTNRTSNFAQPDLLFPVPPGSKGHVPLTSDGVFQPGFSRQITASDSVDQRSSRSSSSTISDQPPLTPTLFDGLALMQDDPSVVRYSQKTGEIMAATPARIVAQISSQSFMDYELVSDFFLTFRTYMSTGELLNLLLARLHWAINRLEDDGRIIRIRTFAALRHWILNYFMDDFVLNRKLRIRFCDQINDMYREVQSRPSGGLSDLKILQDLKRCWNGRCSLYWDSPYFAIDTSLDGDIIPGGFVSTRDSDPSEYLFLDPEKEAIASSVPRMHQHRSAQSWFGQPPVSDVVTGHKRQSSAFAAFGPESPRSELSVQPNSCSVPMSLSRWPVATGNPAQGPHPVPVQMRRNRAPSNLAVSTSPLHSHKRNAGSFDSSRKSTPVNAPEQRVTFANPYAGSLIRGQVFPPASAIVEVLSSVGAKSYHSKSDIDESESGRHKSASPTNPAMKSIFGSIRRALGGKHGMGDITVLTVPGGQQHGPVRGKLLTKTLASTKSHDELRRMVDSRPVRSQMRIDLLCAAAVQNYELAISSISTGTKEQNVHASSGVTMTEDVLSPEQDKAATSASFFNNPRFYSIATAQSGSILIVDDTKLDLPAMSGALPASNLRKSDVGQGSSYSTQTGVPTTKSMFLAEPAAYTASQRSSGLLGTERSASARFPTAKNTKEQTKHWSSDPELTNLAMDEHVTTLQTSTFDQNRNTTSTAASSVTMRRVGSLESTIGHQGAESSFGATRTSVSSPQGDDDDEGDPDMSQSRTLRRRPGGDLKKTQHVHDLVTNQRAQSYDSAIAATDSAGGSLVIMSNKAGEPNDLSQDGPQKKAISMINTHSSQHLRPSFEAAIAGFSAIPDDNDGGLEATLLKLEGKYDPNSPILSQGVADEHDDLVSSRGTSRILRPDSQAQGKDTSLDDGPNFRAPEHASSVYPQEDDREAVDALPDPQQREGLHPWMSGAPTNGRTHAPKATSADSYNLIPLLERSYADDELAVARRSPFKTQDQSYELPISPQRSMQSPPGTASSNKKIWTAAERLTAKEANLNSSFLFPDPSASVRSFLLDEDENLSDMSSEISVDIINQSDLVDRPFSPMFAAPGTATSGLELPSHPLGHYSEPHLTTKAGIPANMQQRMPPTPDPSPKLKQDAQFSVQAPSSLGHIPFILACDSQVLAQQFTLIEKEALGEVEWSDLVDMRWDNKAANILDWVEYLSTKNNKGIDLVITRFNLVVKWALSEIVLTVNIHERARAITKYIHTAAHARRLHNYATMLQLTIALTSNDCTRLTKTWELITAPDRSLLKNMEALIQPLRNFHDLRAEMESADLSEGCIPFIGLYVHDLTYNAQKPSQIAGTRESEPLVNFERYRTAATIIKGLLRLIDASSKYNITPVEGVIERCLWMAALSDERIRALSKALETQN